MRCRERWTTSDHQWCATPALATFRWATSERRQDRVRPLRRLAESPTTGAWHDPVSWYLYWGVEGVVSIADAEDPVIDATDVAARFRAFCASVEPGLRRALIAAYGAAAGRDAAAEALAWAWEHFGRVERMRNPGGYLYRVGQTAARRERVTDRWPLPVSLANESAEPYVEPALAEALAGLSPHQRAAVLLVHGFGYSLSEASQQMGCRIRTLRNHLDRGLGKLRVALGVDIDG